jgi:branched-chain amino acid transport system ATP-binding protein
MLAIARSLMSEPELLLLDEPSLGLAPNLVLLIFELIRKINSQGVTILLVEQNANMALLISNRTYVLETGRIALSGESKKLLNDENIKKAYLGNIN